MDENKNANFCLSGKPKPISKKEESLRERKQHDMMEKLKLPSLQLNRLDGIKRERPKTAVKKKPQSRSNSSSRPTSASIQQKFSYKPRMKRPGMKPSASIDSALSSQHSSAEPSTDEENDSTDDRCSSKSTEDMSEDECSVDSGIIKVRISRCNTDDDHKGGKANTSANSSPSKEPILVKEFNRTPDIVTDDIDADSGMYLKLTLI